MTNHKSYTDEQVLEFIAWCDCFILPRAITGFIRSLLADRQRLQAEVEALRKCALKYLARHHVEDPSEGLERDLRDPEMCGYAAAKYAARVTPNETKEDV